MTTIIRQTIDEWMRRKLGVALLVMCVFLPGAVIATARLKTGPNGLYIGDPKTSPSFMIPEIFKVILVMGSDIWLLLSAFAMAGLLCSYLERGWAELLFTKAQSRWKFLLGRYLAGLLLFAFTVSVMIAIPALYYAQAGWQYIPHQLWRAVLVMTISFSALAATAACVALTRRGMTFPVVSIFLQITLCGVLAAHDSLKPMIPSRALQHALDFIYWVMPKHTELSAAARMTAIRIPVLNTAQLWTTVAFSVAMLALSIWQLERKAI